MELAALSYEKLRMPMADVAARDAEIQKRIAKGFNRPLGFECMVCGFMPCTLVEAATHIIEHQAKGESPQK